MVFEHCASRSRVSPRRTRQEAGADIGQALLKMVFEEDSVRYFAPFLRVLSELERKRAV